MSTNHNRIKVADLEINQPNRILTTNTFGELEFSDINNIKTDCYNALDYSIAGKALDARQGKILKDLIDNINALLASDNVNLDTVQELVDAIETVQISLSTILVNDLTTGGTTKALTAEMGKSLKTQVDTLTTVVSGKQNTLTFSTDLEIDKASTTKVTAIKTLYDWAVAKFVQIANIKTVNGNSLIGTGNVITPDMDTTTAQSVSGLKTFFNGMFGLRNITNTFTSFFTTAATASRTWSFPDKSGTVAMTSDIIAQLNGTVNRLVKFGTSTTGTNSRIVDTGTCLGIGTVGTPTKDITIGNQNDREIGIEQSENITKGRDLIISAGKTINFAPSNFNPYTANTGLYAVIVWADPNGDMYLANSAGNTVWYRPSGTYIFSQTSITGFPFVAQGVHTAGVTQDGTAYACGGGTIFKRTGRSGNFINTGISATKIACSINSNDVYYYLNGSGLFKLINGTGSSINQGVAASTYDGITYSSTNNVYYMQGTHLYKQTNATGAFVDTLVSGLPSTPFKSICITPSNDIYVTDSVGNISIRVNDFGNFTSLQTVSAANYGPSMIASDINNDVYTGEGYANNNVLYWKNNSNTTGQSNLDGGILKLKSGTGKGIGRSRCQIITGQKTTSGTDMQVETLRIEVDESGNYKRIGTPVYANNTAAIAGGLTAGMEYRTNTGVKMEVY